MLGVRLVDDIDTMMPTFPVSGYIVYSGRLEKLLHFISTAKKLNIHVGMHCKHMIVTKGKVMEEQPHHHRTYSGISSLFYCSPPTVRVSAGYNNVK